MIPHVYEHPKMDFESVLEIINYKKVLPENIYSHILFLKEKFAEIGLKKTGKNEVNWIMGELRGVAVGNVDLADLAKRIKEAK
jgi:glutamyl-tRNA(Gln) amidotransferase subunit E